MMHNCVDSVWAFFRGISYASLLQKDAPIVPTGASTKVNYENAKICLMCFETGATTRKCCNGVYCDHCYTKNKLCPNCDTPTRLEKMTGATYVLPVYSEHEECRICLDPGLKRRCCGNYYCDDCYYNQPNCRSCGVRVGRKGSNFGFDRAAVVSILIGYAMTIFIVAACVGAFLTIYVSEMQTPIGINFFNCHGFFRTCDTPVCLDIDPAVAEGTQPMPPLNQYKYCTLDSLAKLQSPACVFDQNLYTATQTLMGFDVCYDSYAQGLYIFEDTFENYGNFTVASNKMKSAKWSNVVNGYSTTFCGAGEINGGTNALTFSGEFDRYAETQDLDVSSGGWLEAELFIAPIGYDITHPECKTSYSAYISVEYSIDHGATWTILDQYDAFYFRNAKFFPVKFYIPPDGETSSTRFKFSQLFFESPRDGWALDNVKVFRYLPTDWRRSQGFLENLKETEREIQLAQCCFDTDWCQSRLSDKEMEECDKFPYYAGKNYELRGSEMYVCIATLINILKFVYVSVQDYLMKKRFPFQDEFYELFSLKWIYELLPARYRPKRSLNEFSNNIHMSARMVAELREQFDDGAGEGDRKKRKDEEKLLKLKEKKRIKKEKKKLAKRMEKKNFRADALEEGLSNLVGGQEKKKGESKGDDVSHFESDSDPDSDEEPELTDADKVKFGTDKIAGDDDKFKRKNVALLRLPFDTKVDEKWLNTFFLTSMAVFVILLLTKFSMMTLYVIHKPIIAYGVLKSELLIHSLGIIIFAMYCDLKEMYYTYKNVIPARKEWVPLITVDLSEESKSLFIGNHQVLLADITETNAFTRRFPTACAVAYYLGCFPWCLFSLIMRDQYLKFGSMRIVTPTLGAIFLIRSLLGPAFVLKMAFSLQIIFDKDMKMREHIGRALQSARSINGAGTGSISFMFVALFFASALFSEFLGPAVGVAFVIGGFYGVFAGCYHALPIRPWMYLTVLEEGVWIRVKKKQKCPCIYWGAYCSDLHDSEELLVISTTNPTKFLSIVKNGMDVANA